MWEKFRVYCGRSRSKEFGRKLVKEYSSCYRERCHKQFSFNVQNGMEDIEEGWR